MLHQSANDKGDNEMIPGAVHRPPGVYRTSEETLGKLNKETIDDSCATSPRLKLGSLLQIRSVGSHST